MGNVYTKSGALARRIYFGATTVWENLYYFLQKRVLEDGGTFVENDVLISDDGASLILTPNAFKAGKLYSAKPDFGAGDFIVQRNSTATYVGQDGLIKTALANVLRIEDGAILTEPQSTNLYLNSATLATQNITTTASIYTVSFYGTGTITFSGSYSGSLVGTGATIRVSKTFTATAGTLTSTISGTVTEGQCENLTYPTSYIPTNGTTETRLEDEITDAGDVTTFNSEEGVLYIEFSKDDETNYITKFGISDGSITNQLIIQTRFSYSLTGALTILGVTNIISTNGLDFKIFNKIALVWALNRFELWVNGVKIIEDLTLGTFPINTLNKLSFAEGNRTDDSFFKTKQIQVFKTALTDAQLIALTTI